MRTPADYQSATSPESFRGGQVGNLRYRKTLPRQEIFAH